MRKTREKMIAEIVKARQQAEPIPYTELGERYGFTAVHARRLYLQAMSTRSKKARESLKKIQARRRQDEERAA